MCEKADSDASAPDAGDAGDSIAAGGCVAADDGASDAGDPMAADFGDLAGPNAEASASTSVDPEVVASDDTQVVIGQNGDLLDTLLGHASTWTVGRPFRSGGFRQTQFGSAVIVCVCPNRATSDPDRAGSGSGRI